MVALVVQRLRVLLVPAAVGQGRPVLVEMVVRGPLSVLPGLVTGPLVQVVQVVQPTTPQVWPEIYMVVAAVVV